METISIFAQKKWYFKKYVVDPMIHSCKCTRNKSARATNVLTEISEKKKNHSENAFADPEKLLKY
jgi:hypothetical protein